MSPIHEGGCLCGAVRYRVRMTQCARASAIGAYFREADVELRGELKTYEYRSDESGRWLKMQFCPNSISGGSFDDPDWLKIDRHGWTRSKQKWVRYPPGVELFERAALQPPA